eukprot:scaffold25700_cov79-Isochrysis_galbana.AAC.1
MCGPAAGDDAPGKMQSPNLVPGNLTPADEGMRELGLLKPRDGGGEAGEEVHAGAGVGCQAAHGRVQSPVPEVEQRQATGGDGCGPAGAGLVPPGEGGVRASVPKAGDGQCGQAAGPADAQRVPPQRPQVG